MFIEVKSKLLILAKKENIRIVHMATINILEFFQFFEN